jgi:hypothetical protein
MAPNCPNGHPWNENARLSYRVHRYCLICTIDTAAQSRTYSATYTGKCPKGHPYTRANTMIVSTQNSKVCLTCKHAIDARPRLVSEEVFQEIMRRARAGETANALSGRKSHRGNVVLSNSITIVHFSNLKTTEGRELKQLLAQNAKMSRYARFGVKAWLPNRREFLAAQLVKSSDVAEVTKALNNHFGSSHREQNVQLRAWKWGLKFSEKSSTIVAAPASLRFPHGSLMERLVALLPKNLARDHRDDLIGEIAMAVFGERIPEANLEAHVRVLVSRSFKADHNPWGDISLDAPIFRDGVTTFVDTVTTGLWQ